MSDARQKECMKEIAKAAETFLEYDPSLCQTFLALLATEVTEHIGSKEFDGRFTVKNKKFDITIKEIKEQDNG